jgi:hypothetical protein
MFNFQSLAEAITPEEDSKEDGAPQHIENVAGANGVPVKEAWNGPDEPSAAANELPEPSTSNKSGLEDSALTIKPRQPQGSTENGNDHGDEIEPAPRIEVVNDDTHLDQKHIGEVNMMDELRHQATQ